MALINSGWIYHQTVQERKFGPRCYYCIFHSCSVSFFLVSCDGEEIKALGSPKMPQGREYLSKLRRLIGQARVLGPRAWHLSQIHLSVNSSSAPHHHVTCYKKTVEVKSVKPQDGVW